MSGISKDPQTSFITYRDYFVHTDLYISMPIHFPYDIPFPSYELSSFNHIHVFPITIPPRTVLCPISCTLNFIIIVVHLC